MKYNDQFYNGLVGFSFLTIGVLIAPVASAETRRSSVASITPQMIARSGPVTITAPVSARRVVVMYSLGDSAPEYHSWLYAINIVTP